MALTSRFTNRRLIPATLVRQGGLGRPVLIVLMVSTFLAALALLGAWMSNADRLAASESSAKEKIASAQPFQSPQTPVREVPAP